MDRWIKRIKNKIIKVAPSAFDANIVYNGSSLEIEIPYYVEYRDLKNIEEILFKKGCKILSIRSYENQIIINCRC